MIDTRWFSEKLADRRLSQRGLAKLMGLDPSAISLALRGRRKLTLDEASQIAVILNVTTQEVLKAAGVEMHGTDLRVHVIGTILGDETVKLEPEGIRELVDAPPHVPTDAVALIAKTSGSRHEMIDGWIYYLPSTHGSPASCIGLMAMCAVKGNGLVLCGVKRGYKRGTYNLMSRNGEMIHQNAELAWASPVLWIKTTAI